MSVLEITEPVINKSGEPAKGGPNDPRMGIVKAGQSCATCFENMKCQGHFGHIKLMEPVYNVGYMKFILKILKCVCHNCGRLKSVASDTQTDKLI